MIAWDRIDTVLLDMDGTLLDLHFDNHFWNEYVPRCYAAHHGMTLAAARADVTARYRRVEGTLDWYCVDYWTRTLGIDIGRHKHALGHLIALRPHTLEFLAALRARGKRRVLVTNAHNTALELKLARTALAGHLDAIVCSHDLGFPKEHAGFWERLQRSQPFERDASVLIDDSLPVLRAARAYGIGQLLAVARPDSRQPRREITEFPAVEYLSEVMP